MVNMNRTELKSQLRAIQRRRAWSDETVLAIALLAMDDRSLEQVVAELERLATNEEAGIAARSEEERRRVRPAFVERRSPDVFDADNLPEAK